MRGGQRREGRAQKKKSLQLDSMRTADALSKGRSTGKRVSFGVLMFTGGRQGGHALGGNKAEGGGEGRKEMRCDVGVRALGDVEVEFSQFDSEEAGEEREREREREQACHLSWSTNSRKTTKDEAVTCGRVHTAEYTASVFCAFLTRCRITATISTQSILSSQLHVKKRCQSQRCMSVRVTRVKSYTMTKSKSVNVRVHALRLSSGSSPLPKLTLGCKNK